MTDLQSGAIAAAVVLLVVTGAGYFVGSYDHPDHWVHVEQTGPDAQEEAVTVAYENLTDEQREEFQEALDDDDLPTDEPALEPVADSDTYVRYRGDTYAVYLHTS